MLDLRAKLRKRGWQFFERVIIPDIYQEDETYLDRYIYFRTPWFGMQKHRILMEDSDRHPHNHPRVFWTWIIKGGYYEEYRTSREVYCDCSWRETWIGKEWKRWSLHKMNHKDFHRIDTLHGPTTTLVFVGRKVQTWGYLTQDGFVDHNTYWETKGYLGYKKEKV